MTQITKRAIEQSLKNLLAEKPLTKVTISDIAADCGINRMTFYYHFKDIYDLVEWCCREDARRALEGKPGESSWQQGLLRIFHTVQENKVFVLNVYRCIHQEKLESYLKPLVDDLVLTIIRQELGTMTVAEEDQAFLARIYCHILIGVMMDWIKEDMRTDPEGMVGQLSILLTGTMADGLRRFAAS